MASDIIIIRKFNGDRAFVRVNGIIKTSFVTETFLKQRLGLGDQGVSKIVDSENDSWKFPFLGSGNESGRRWLLSSGKTYFLFSNEDHPVVGPDKGKGVAVTELADSSESKDEPIVIGSNDAFAQSSRASPDVDPEIPRRRYHISALDSLMSISGTSELSKFVKEDSFKDYQVDHLPSSYNGDLVYELLPVDSSPAKGARFRDMDREQDCYLWARLVRTSANVAPKNVWDFGKVLCTGHLECRNQGCAHLKRTGTRNQVSWKGRFRAERPFQPDHYVPEGGVVCAHCEQAPFCVKTCEAKMFYMYPAFNVEQEQMKVMSRLAIHVGEHNHPPRTVFSRDSVKKAGAVLQEKYIANPTATPSRLKHVSTKSIMAELYQDSTKDLAEDKKVELFDSLKVISTPHKFESLLRSVKIDQPGKGEIDILVKMQRQMRFPFIQRWGIPGQGSPEERVHVFKMSVFSHGSGVDLLRQMLPGEPLEGSWVMYDVMYRMTTDWYTLSSHVYDHNYRALCTIFTCEIKGEDTPSYETAWQLMLDVARQYGLEDVVIHGFMADNSQAGWNSMRNIFWGGLPNPDREWSDAFHFKQSLRRHTLEGIFEHKCEEHYGLWDELRNAKNVVEAYRVGNRISSWWQAGNCIPGKLKMLTGWMAWWIVRWRQSDLRFH